MLVILVLAASLATIDATQPVPHTIIAHEFDVVDGAGNVRLIMGPSPEVALFNANGQQRAALALASDGAPTLMLMDAKGWGIAQMSVTQGSPEILFTRSRSQGPGSIFVGLTSQGLPRIHLSDPQGFDMDLGSTQMVTPATGATEQTSGASIVMFGNDKEHRVIWKAP